MQGSSAASATATGGVQPEAILEWLQKEMGYRPSGKSLQQLQLPTPDSLRRICRGNMIPVWAFLLKRVKSEKTVEGIRKNITIHGGGMTERRSKEELSGGDGDKEAATRERDAAAKEVERLRSSVRRERKELRARMLDVCREEAERKRMLDERSKNRHKQVILEAYDQQCDEASKIFAEYHKRLCHFVNQARDSQRTVIDDSAEVDCSLTANSEKESVYSNVRGSKSADDVILFETTLEKNIRRACEYLAWQTVDRIRCSFPSYEGSGIHLNVSSEGAKLGIDFGGEVPQDIQAIVANCLKNPNLLLEAITAYTLQLKSLICREIEKIDVKADAEILRYKYENNRVMDASSPDGSSTLHHQLYGNGKPGNNLPSGGSQNQLLERQKAHVQQFLATEDARNKAAVAKDLSQKIIQRLHGNDEAVSSHTLGLGGATQNIASLRQFELDVWAKEREVVGLRASLNTLMSEIQRLKKLCAERKEAEDSLRQKWKKIEEFDARRSELEAICNSLLKANTDAAAFWDRQPLTAREFSLNTIIPACTMAIDRANNAKDLINKEVDALAHCPDNSLYMLPSTTQALLEFMGSTGSTGPEAIAAAERNAFLLTSRAGVKDLSAIPSICRVSAALQYPAGLEGSDASLASLLESLEFCLKLRGSEASVLEDLAKAIHLVHVRQELVESCHSLLNHAYRAQQEYDRTTSYCLNLANDQEKTIVEKWVPELKTAAHNAQKSVEDCKYVRGLLDEWWEQPASTVVDWVTVDGQNVGTWHNHVKQLLAYYDKKL